MCELFAVSLKNKIQVNKYLYYLREHSHQHPDGWGVAVFDKENERIVREKLPAYESDLYAQILSSPLEVKDMIGHVRLATRGGVIDENCHPFVGEDDSNRTWTLMHNGTIFESKILDVYKDEQKGTTDSERIFLHVIKEANRLNHECSGKASVDERLNMMDSIILSIARPNKLNLMVYDGEVLYVHTNMKDTLFYKEIKEGLVFGTSPLDEDEDSWKPLEMMRLLAFKEGKQIFSGTGHDYEYRLQ